MRLRVCILAEPNPFTWVSHYVEAFRECCDVITIGPAPRMATLSRRRREHLARLITPNDIITQEQDALDALKLLPEDWRPHLVVAIQSGFRALRRVARVAVPTAYISVDTWHDLTEYIFARHFDFAFVAQRDFTQPLRDTGSRHVHWLPLACSPTAHQPIESPKNYDIAFVGSSHMPAHRDRRRRLELLKKRFCLAQADGLSTRDMCALMSRARSAFNSSIFSDVNMRVFETLAMGCPLFTNADAQANGLLDLFEDGKHLIAYTDENLLEKVSEYLADETALADIARAGREEVLAKHTYRHRVNELLRVVRAAVPDLERPAPLLRDLGALTGHLPTPPGIVVDLDMNLDRSKIALRGKGLTRLIGVSDDESVRRRFGRSYDEILAYPELAGLQADTVVMGSPPEHPDDLRDAIRTTHAMLSDGGTLVLRLTDTTLARLGLSESAKVIAGWLVRQGFHLIRAGGEAVNASGKAGPTRRLLVSARKRTKDMHAVIRDVYGKYPMAHKPLDTILYEVQPDI